MGLLEKINEYLKSNYRSVDDVPREELLRLIYILIVAIELEAT